MKCAKTILPLFIFGVLVSSNINYRTSKEVNAWTFFESSLKSSELESTFISEEKDDEGVYHYKYHIKNISDFYINEFVIYGPYQLPNEDFTRSQYDTVKVKNNYFDYGTLLIGPNQEMDVEFCLSEKIVNFDAIEVTAYGYNTDINKGAKIVDDVILRHSTLSLTDPNVYLTFRNKDNDCLYYAILKGNVDGNDYYFVVSEENNYHVYGNYINRCNDNVEIELTKVIKKSKTNTQSTEQEIDKKSNPWNAIVFILAFPFVLTFGVAIVTSLVIALCIIICLAKKKRKKAKNNQDF